MGKSKVLQYVLVMILLVPAILAASDDGPASWWKFDEADGKVSLESVGKAQDEIYGRIKYVSGVLGTAIRLDGFRTYVKHNAKDSPSISGAFSVEAWVAIGAYPWLLGPIVDHRDQSGKGYIFGMDKEGHFGFSLAAGGKWQRAFSENTVPLRRWTHLVGVYDPQKGITLYRDGEAQDDHAVDGAFEPAKDKDMFIGRNYIQEPWPDYQYTTEGHYSFLDGIIDELKIYRRALTAQEIETAYKANQTMAKPDLEERVFPAVHKDCGPFGAYYTKLDYYDEWDALWRVSEVADVILQFDQMKCKLVFWRGTGFVPCWVTENGIWLTHEWLETWGSDVSSCAEPLMDRQCRFSHVRILESHDARAVVHWRYPLVDADYKFVAVSDDGRGEWCDEFYTIYPDGVGIRKMMLHYSKPPRPHDWAEQIVVLPPGQHPKEVIAAPEVTLINMEGQEHNYTWNDDLPVKFTEPNEANIEIINLKSKYRPFLIVSPEPFQTVEMEAKSPFFRSYSAKQASTRYRPESVPSVYGWWNHWPIAQVPGDGRWVVTLDRASHFNLTTFVQWKDYELTERTRTRIMLNGLTEKRGKDVAELAKSWLQAPALELACDGYRNMGYDQAEMAYVLRCDRTDQPMPLQLQLTAGDDNPLVNPAFLIKQWGRAEARVVLDGEPLKRGNDCRIGHVSTLQGVNLVIWLRMETTRPVRLTIQPVQTPE
jgi:hypothetical protein